MHGPPGTKTHCMFVPPDTRTLSLVDQDGDVDLVICESSSTDGGSPKRRVIRVSSQVLVDSSDYFRHCISDGFRDYTQRLRASTASIASMASAPSANPTAPRRPFPILLKGVDFNVLLDMMNWTHTNQSRLHKATVIPLSYMNAIAFTTEVYRMNRAMYPLAEELLPRVPRRSRKWDQYIEPNDLQHRLIIAWVFKDSVEWDFLMKMLVFRSRIASRKGTSVLHYGWGPHSNIEKLLVISLSTCANLPIVFREIKRTRILAFQEMYLFFLRAARSQLQAQPPRKIFIHGKPATFNSLKKLITKVFNLLPFNRGCTIEALWNDLQQELFLQVDGWTDVGTNLEQLAEGIWLLQWWDAKFGFLNIYLNRCRTMDDRKLQWCLPENKRSIVPSEELYKSTYQYLLSKTTSRLLSRIG